MHYYANEIIQHVYVYNVLTAIYAICKTLFKNILTTKEQCYKEIRVSGFLYAYLEIKCDFDAFNLMIYGLPS